MRMVFLYTIALPTIVSSWMGSVAAQPTRPWTTADSTAVRYVPFDSSLPNVTYMAEDGLPSTWAKLPKVETTAPIFSPSGFYFFILDRRGDLQGNGESWALAIYDSAAARLAV